MMSKATMEIESSFDYIIEHTRIPIMGRQSLVECIATEVRIGRAGLEAVRKEIKKLEMENRSLKRKLKQYRQGR